MIIQDSELKRKWSITGCTQTKGTIHLDRTLSNEYKYFSWLTKWSLFSLWPPKVRILDPHIEEIHTS